MKRWPLFLLAVLTVFLLLGCEPSAPQVETTLPDTTQATVPDTTQPTTLPPATADPGSTLAGVDISGLEPEEAAQAVKNALESYTLTFAAGNRTVTVTAQELGLQIKDGKLSAYLEALCAGQEPEKKGLAVCDSETAAEAIYQQTKIYPQNASVVYSSESGQFIPKDGVNGWQLDKGQIAALLAKAVSALETHPADKLAFHPIAPKIKADHKSVQKMAQEANSYLALKLSYVYEAEGLPKTTVKISPKTLASFVVLDNQDYTVGISTGAIGDYAGNMAKAYHGEATYGRFKTSYGSTIGYTVQYYGSQVDREALTADIKKCLKNHISGTRKAPYTDANTELPYGGSYIEADLTSQRVYVYRDGKQVLSAGVVSGSVVTGHYTPTGVYSVVDKDTGATLKGQDYVEYVNYWIGFLGTAYGFHDASWRGYGEFGTQQYIYDGSHGCVNMYISDAKTLYNNVSVGTPVIIYGGMTSAKTEDPTFSGTASYTKTVGDKPFTLDAAPDHKGGAISYHSANPKVAKVDSTGKVTVVGPGTTTITLKTTAFHKYNAGSFTITVTVREGCDTAGHRFGPWVTEQPHPCQEGVKKATCSVCGEEKKESVAPTASHSYGDWHQTSVPTCTETGLKEAQCKVCHHKKQESIPALGHSFSGGAVCDRDGCTEPNPNYRPPETTPPDTTLPETTPPDTTVPDTTVPDTVPETTAPESTAP